LYAAWYDFHSDGSHGDIYLRIGRDGKFEEVQGILDFQVTQAEGDFVSHWMPTLEVLPDETIHLVWGRKQGFSGTFILETMAIMPNGDVSDSTVIDEKGSSFFDPHKLLKDSEGNMALIYAGIEGNSKRIHVRYRPRGGVWSEARYVDPGEVIAQKPVGVFLPNGNLAIVWQDNRDGLDAVYLAEYDPVGESLVSEQKVSPEDSMARVPTLAVQPGTRNLAAAWIEEDWEGNTRIKLAVTEPTSVDGWMMY
jgi:hypothetical protein